MVDSPLQPTFLLSNLNPLCFTFSLFPYFLPLVVIDKNAYQLFSNKKLKILIDHLEIVSHPK